MKTNIVCNDLLKKNCDIYEEIKKYFNDNKQLLNDIYFYPKKINENSIKDKLDDSSYLNRIKLTLKLYSNVDLKEYINKSISDFVIDTGYKIDAQEIYVIIGLNTTTIYSVDYNGKPVTVILLESTSSIEYLKMLLAHEFTHWVRSKFMNNDIFETCIGERFVTEGIACLYSKEQVPDKKDSEYCIVPDSTVKWCEENIILIDELSKESLNDKSKMEIFFYMYANIAIINMPVRTGYVYGYFKVLNYISSRELKVKEILAINWREIFN